MEQVKTTMKFVNCRLFHDFQKFRAGNSKQKYWIVMGTNIQSGTDLREFAFNSYDKYGKTQAFSTSTTDASLKLIIIFVKFY